MAYHYYFAGALFCHKELIGNHLLAEAIRNRSNGNYIANLPQKEENQLRPSPLEIRDNDFRLLLESQLALFNFDGTELDSGTVVEFMAARFLQIPCVLFRTDFRSAGDQNADGEAWNLMCSGYPRTKVRFIGAMESYQRVFRETAGTAEALNRYYSELADALIEDCNGSGSAGGIPLFPDGLRRNSAGTVQRRTAPRDHRPPRIIRIRRSRIRRTLSSMFRVSNSSGTSCPYSTR